MSDWNSCARVRAVVSLFALGSAAAFASSFHDKNGVVDPKWAVYGGPMDAIDTEVQGRVLWIWGNSIYLAVDPGYQHLLLTRHEPAASAGRSHLGHRALRHRL